MEQKRERRYFIELQGEQAGPFTHDQLRAKHVRRNTPVWDEDKWAWINAGTIDALADLFTRTGSAVVHQHRSFSNWLKTLRAKFRSLLFGR